MENYTIAEEYTLPSKGLVYNKQVNPNVKIRSMTTEEEMKRLGHSDLPYKLLSEIIESCLVEKPGIPVYDLCIGDYQFLLHKLRVVTYGPDYRIRRTCPICGVSTDDTIDLDSLEVIEYNENFSKYLDIDLPVTKKHIQLKLQTPRVLDEIAARKKELLKKSSNIEGEPAFLFTVESMIESVDGQVLDSVKLENFLRHLPMKDVNYILKSIDKIDLGINTIINYTCSNCGNTYNQSLPFTGEFFGPSID